MHTNCFQLIRAPSVLGIALAFAFTGLAFLATILISRIFKTYRKHKYENLRNDFQKTLNKLIMLQVSKNTLSHFSMDFYMKDLGHKIRSSFSKQVLIDLLIANKQNLKGDSAVVLKKIYIRLHLKRYSGLKLSSWNLMKKIQGLQELAEMECNDMLPAVQELFTHKKLIIQQESFVAMVRLASASPFVLVDHYKSPITPWMQLTIHKHMNSMPPERLPKFWRWFYSSNRDIQRFAISMVDQFRQLESIPHLALLLKSLDLETAGMAAEVLGGLGAVQYADAIVKLGKEHPFHEPLSLKVIGSLAQIGNGEAHGEFLAWHMIHGSHNVRMEAMHAMQKLNLNPRDFLVDFNGLSDGDFDSIHAHVSNPLL